MNAEGDAPLRKNRVDLGMRVIVELISFEGPDRMELEIVPDRYADVRLGYLGAGTQLARAIIGHAAGETVPYAVEGIDSVKIIQVSPSELPPPKEVADRREETIRKAVDQSDRTNAVIFASSFSGKWGDYDPNSFKDDVEDSDSPSKK